jgi:hypothetical protein
MEARAAKEAEPPYDGLKDDSVNPNSKRQQVRGSSEVTDAPVEFGSGPEDQTMADVEEKSSGFRTAEPESSAASNLQEIAPSKVTSPERGRSKTRTVARGQRSRSPRKIQRSNAARSLWS